MIPFMSIRSIIRSILSFKYLRAAFVWSVGKLIPVAFNACSLFAAAMSRPAFERRVRERDLEILLAEGTYSILHAASCKLLSASCCGEAKKLESKLHTSSERAIKNHECQKRKSRLITIFKF